MTHVSSTITIYAPVDAIWQVISDFGAVCEYLSRVVSCTVEGVGVGALRRLASADGSIIVERLEVLDTAAYRLSYALLINSPFRNCLTSMALHCLGSNQTKLEWSASFQADGLPASEAAELLEGALADNCLALKQFMEAVRD